MQIFNFKIFFPTVFLFWLVGTIIFYAYNKSKTRNIGLILIAIGMLYISLMIAYLWINLERPPLRTLGETRLWYTVFVPLVGAFLYFRWKMKWVVGYSVFLASVFLFINYLTPENFDKALMPALQSVWFVPHVVVYMFAYSILSVTMLLAIKGLYRRKLNMDNTELMKNTDNVVYIGFAFLSFGLLFGAFWAKKAWGHYWTWDPKETWSFITWLFYLIYIHLRYNHRQNEKAALWTLALAFVFLLICWFGINYLPSAQTSVHTYST